MKQLFDFVLSSIALVFFLPFLLIIWLILVISTKSNSLFFQQRVGQFGQLFTIYKFKTMQPNSEQVTKFGWFLRKYKLDELPQLINVLKGDMSLVGPRPDIQGYYDVLKNENRKILELKPGITSEASLKYYNDIIVM